MLGKGHGNRGKTGRRLLAVGLLLVMLPGKPAAADGTDDISSRINSLNTFLTIPFSLSFITYSSSLGLMMT